MFRWLYLLPAGIFSHSLLPSLPAARWLALLLVISLLMLVSRPWLRPAAIVGLGLAIGGLWGNTQLQYRLPVGLDKAEVVVRGTVSSLVMGDSTRKVFNFQVEDIVPPVPADFPGLRKLRLSWYGDADIQPGERWQLRVRLRAPRGYSNPGGFDYSGWLFSQGISATGYVREGGGNQRLAPPYSLSLATIRQQLLARLLSRQDLDPEVAGVMAALILGEQGLIPGDRNEAL